MGDKEIVKDRKLILKTDPCAGVYQPDLRLGADRAGRLGFDISFCR